MKPPWAAYIWHDANNLFLQLPDSGYITKLPFTEGGMGKGLKLIKYNCQAPNGHVPKQALAKRSTVLKLRPTEASKATAKAILKKAGIV
jgi:hypothetical protein